MQKKEYIDLITSQHKKPRFKAWVNELITHPDTNDQLDIIDAFLIDSAIGVQLDTLGKYIGVKRNLNFQPSDQSSPILDDVMYRKVLKSWVVRNHWDGTNGTISAIWADIYNDSQLNIIDNQDMTMSAMVTNLGDTPLLQELITHGYIIPKPEGVRLKLIFREIQTVDMPMVICAAVLDFAQVETEIATWPI